MRKLPTPKLVILSKADGSHFVEYRRALQGMRSLALGHPVGFAQDDIYGRLPR